MNLREGHIGSSYVVRELKQEHAVMRRLEALGILEGTNLYLLNKKNNGAVIVKVRGTRWAIGKKLAEGILVDNKL